MHDEFSADRLLALTSRLTAAAHSLSESSRLAPALLEATLAELPQLDEIALYRAGASDARQALRLGSAHALPATLPYPVEPAVDAPHMALVPLVGGGAYAALAAHGPQPLGDELRVLLKGAGEIMGLALAREAHQSDSATTLQALFQAMNDVIMVLDAEGRYLDIAPTNPNLLFKPPQDMLGKLTAEVLPPDVARTVLEAIEAALRDNTSIDVEYMLTLEASEYWFAATVSPLDVDRVLLVARDITPYRSLLQVAERSLDRRSRQVQTLNEVAHELVSIPRLEDLFARVVTLVKDRFGYAHVQIFRYDPALHVMRLVVGYGDVGARMLAAGHHLPLERGVVGTAAATGNAVLATDVTSDPDWVPHPDLPHTRGELAVPIKLRGEVLGILDVQSDTAGALTNEDLLLLETLSGGIATAFESARLVSQATLFREMVEASTLGIGIGSLDDMHLVYANHMMFETLGVSDRQAALNASFLELYSPENQVTIQETVLPAVLAEGQWTGEVDLTTRDGRVIPTFHTVFLIRDQHGDAHHIAVQFADVSLSRAAEARLAEERNLLRTLIDTLPDYIYVKDRASRMVINNVAHAVDVLGADSPEAVMGRTDFDFFPEHLANQYYAEEQQMMDSGVALMNHEHPNEAPDGSLTWHIRTKVPLRDGEGNITGVVGVSRDITDLKKRELERNRLLEAEQRQRALAETLAEISLTLSSQTTYTGVLDEILNFVLRLSPGTQGASIALVQRNTLILERIHTRQGVTPGVTWTGQAVPMQQLPVTRLIMQQQQPFIVNVLADENRAVVAQLGLEWVESFAVLPIVLRDTVLGMIWLASIEPNTYNMEDLRILQPVANAAAIALENARLIQTSEARANRQQRLNEISVRFQQTSDISELLSVAMQELGPTLGAKVGRVRLSIPDDQPVHIPDSPLPDSGHDGAAREDL